MWLLKCTWNFRNFKLEFLFNSKPPSLGPVFAVGEKGKKRGEMISTSEARPAVAWGWGKGGGAWRHAGFWYHALIGQTSLCLQIRGAVSRSFNVTFLLFGNNTNFFARLRSSLGSKKRNKYLSVIG